MYKCIVIFAIHLFCSCFDSAKVALHNSQKSLFFFHAVHSALKTIHILAVFPLMPVNRLYCSTALTQLFVRVCQVS